MADNWLQEKLSEAIPTPTDLAFVRGALDRVETCLERAGGKLRIAERHPCGWYAKKAIPIGRSEKFAGTGEGIDEGRERTRR